MINIDMWYGDSYKEADKIDINFSEAIRRVAQFMMKYAENI